MDQSGLGSPLLCVRFHMLKNTAAQQAEMASCLLRPARCPVSNERGLVQRLLTGPCQGRYACVPTR